MPNKMTVEQKKLAHSVIKALILVLPQAKSKAQKEDRRIMGAFCEMLLDDIRKNIEG